MNPLLFIGREATVRLGPEWTLEVDHATLTTQWRCGLEVSRCRARTRIQSRNSLTNTIGKNNLATVAPRGKFFRFLRRNYEWRLPAPCTTPAPPPPPTPKSGQHPRANMLERDKSFRCSNMHRNPARQKEDSTTKTHVTVLWVGARELIGRSCPARLWHHA